MNLESVIYVLQSLAVLGVQDVKEVQPHLQRALHALAKQAEQALADQSQPAQLLADELADLLEAYVRLGVHDLSEIVECIHHQVVDRAQDFSLTGVRILLERFDSLGRAVPSHLEFRLVERANAATETPDDTSTLLWLASRPGLQPVLVNSVLLR